VAIIPNNTEGTFGLQSLTPSKLLWIVPEVKEDFNLDQAQFQSLVSHEKLALPRKHQSQFEGHIMSQGILAGNLTPQKWNDNAASIQRRVFLINFAKLVGKAVGNLLERMQTEELAAIIRKIVYCYLRAVDLVGDQDIWRCGLLSTHIIQQHVSLGESANPLKRYFKMAGNEGPVKKLRTIDNPTEFHWCPLNVFADAFGTWRREKDDGKKTVFADDFYTAIFADEGLMVEQAAYQWGEDPFVQDGKIVVGAVPINLTASMVRIDGQDNPLIRPRSDDRDPYRVTQEMYDRRA
jgi:hypothetical protein